MKILRLIFISKIDQPEFGLGIRDYYINSTDNQTNARNQIVKLIKFLNYILK